MPTGGTSHAADATEKRAVFREGHAEGTPTDMREYLMPLMVRPLKANDVADAGSDIEVVVVVEDDVFRAVDLTEAQSATTSRSLSFSA